MIYQIPEPILFNLLKHHLGFIKDFVESNIENPRLDKKILSRELNHIGTTMMDIYTGSLHVRNICEELKMFLRNNDLSGPSKYSLWAGVTPENFRIITLSDDSQWTMKFHDDHNRYVHVFPARNSKYTFRVKGNTLKSALIYLIIIGKDMVTGEDLNKVRPLLELSPVKGVTDAGAILEMIEILRG